MRHNQNNTLFQFQQAPVNFNKLTNKATLQYCLGGTLYMPGTRKVIEKLLDCSLPSLTSMVMCLEDAIKEEEVTYAEDNVLNHLSTLYTALQNHQLDLDQLPLIFLRVRDPDQFRAFIKKLQPDQAQILTGFVFPKFYSHNAHLYLSELRELNLRLNTTLYGMPILEGRAIAYRESRVDELQQLKSILRPYQDLILNIRVGGTDFSSLFGVRRSMYFSVYDILPVRDALSDILNFFNRADDGYVVSAPVWEYFLAYKQDDLNTLVESDIHHSLMAKNPILNPAIDGLLREILQDKTNGMVGKTVIHPSHLVYVNAMQAVTLEEYQDAKQILEAKGGVIKSGHDNKMNEANPHRNWAHRVLLRAQAFGVINSDDDYIKLFMTTADAA